MIGLDFGILFSVQASVAGLPATNSGFRIMPDRRTKSTLDRLQSVSRFLDNKAYVFASDIIGRYEEEALGNTRPARLKEVNQNISSTFLVGITDKRLYSLLDFSYRPGDIPALKNLPDTFKRIYYIDAGQLPGANPIDRSAIIGLAPPVLAMARSEVEFIRSIKSGKTLSPSNEDDQTVQYNFRNAVVGLYELSLNIPAPNTRIFYADPEVFSRPPFAIIELEVPQGAFTLKEYIIEFKNK